MNEEECFEPDEIIIGPSRRTIEFLRSALEELEQSKNPDCLWLAEHIKAFQDLHRVEW